MAREPISVKMVLERMENGKMEERSNGLNEIVDYRSSKRRKKVLYIYL